MKITKLYSVFGIAFSAVAVLSLFGQETKAFAQTKASLVFDSNNVCEFGSYPTKIALEVNSAYIIANGTYDDKTNIYTYNNERYIISDTNVDSEHVFTLSNGDLASDYSSKEVVFKSEPLKWVLYEEGEGYIDLICASILSTKTYHNSGFPSSYLDSDLKAYADSFYESFTDKEKESIMLQKIDSGEAYVTIPEYNSFINKGLKHSFTPSDLAIMKGLSSHLIDPIENSPFWTSTVVGDRITVSWNGKTSTNCLVTDERIGFLPIIRLKSDSSGSSGGGGGSSSAPSSPVIPFNFSGNVPLMIIGFIFIIGGSIFLIVILKKWHGEIKLTKIQKPKPKVIVGGGITLTILIIGLYIFSFGTVVKINTFGTNRGVDLTGYYSGNDCDCLNWGERLLIGLTDDHKVYRYVGDAWDETYGGSNFVYFKQEGEGIWEVVNGNLVIHASPLWRLSSWEKLDTTYVGAHGIGSFVKYEGYEGTAYQWYHSNNKKVKNGSVYFNETKEVW